MDKVKLTSKQEEALKEFKKDDKFEKFVNQRHLFRNVYKPLKDFTPEQFALMLVGWYEVEPSFKEGDIVTSERTGVIYRIVKLHELSADLKTGSNNIATLYLEDIRPATDVEKMFYHLGRQKVELKNWDVLVIDHHDVSIVTQSSKDALKEMLDEVKYIYPAEERVGKDDE